MHDAHLTGAVWRMANLTDAERRDADDSMGRLYAQFRRRVRALYGASMSSATRPAAARATRSPVQP